MRRNKFKIVALPALQKLRLERGFTPLEVGKECGVSKQRIHQIEQGLPSGVTTARRIRIFFDLTFEELFEIIEEE